MPKGYIQGAVRTRGDVNQFSYRPEYRQLRRKNNDLVAAMYALYLTGKSLEQVGEVYKKSRQAVYDQFRCRGYQLRPKKKLPEKIIDGIKFTPSHKGGYWRATGRKKNVMLSHFLYQKHVAPVPAGYGVHHKDLNRNNFDLTNLELLTIAEISSKYSPHLNQFTSPHGSRKKKGEKAKFIWSDALLNWKRY